MQLGINKVIFEEWEDSAREVAEEIDAWAEHAWNDVNSIRLPIDKARAARREEVDHAKGKTFVVAKKADAWRVTGRHP